ncbi:MAG: restriction endonuclease subunit S [Staphylococcus capitis]|nr:MAG: restriction endonuclease subunit S [Staphylococcus capitis]
MNASKEQYGSGKKFINVLDVLNNNFITYDKIIGKVNVSEEIQSRNKVEYGDILFLRSSETREDVGIANVYLDKEFALYGGFIIRGKKINDYSPLFLKNTLSNPKTRHTIGSNAGGSTRFNVSQDILKKIAVYLPKVEEQEKIDDLCSKLDRQIELEEEKLELLEQQKKGYIQKVFSQELRFKDENGNDYPNWETSKIKELGSVYTGNTPSKKQTKYWDSSEYIWITPTDMTEKKNVRSSEYMLSDKGFKKARQLPKNTLLITCIASIGKNAIMREEGSCNQQINALVPNDNNNVDFLYYAFEKVSKYMKRIAGRTATQIVNKSTFENISIEVPNFEVQLKIGRFLNSLDKLIEKQNSKVELLKQRKQGLLQKMFV